MFRHGNRDAVASLQEGPGLELAFVSLLIYKQIFRKYYLNTKFFFSFVLQKISNQLNNVVSIVLIPFAFNDY